MSTIAEMAPETAVQTERPAPRLGGNGTVGKTVFHAAQRSIEFFDHLRTHYREARRTSVDIPVDLKLRLADGTIFDSGTARIVNLSPSGALLTQVTLCRNCYPTQGFKLEIVMRGGEYEGIGLEARPVRFAAEGGLGVKFEEIFVAV